VSDEANEIGISSILIKFIIVNHTYDNFNVSSSSKGKSWNYQ